MGEIFKIILWNQEKECPPRPLLFSIVLKVLTSIVNQEKESNGISIRKKKNVIHKWCDYLHSKSKRIYRQIFRNNNVSIEVAACKVNK